MARLDLKDSYHMLFWEEARDQISVIEQELLQIEAGTSTNETINNIFRMAHSLKGAAATLMLKDLMAIAHALESLLTLVKTREISLNGTIMDILLESLDVIKAIHENLLVSDDEYQLLKPAISKIEQVMEGSKHAATPVPEVLETMEKSLGIRIRFDEAAELLSLKAYIVINALSEHGKVISVTPEDYEQLEDEAFGEFLEICLQTEDSEAALMATLDDITELKTIEFFTNMGNDENDISIIETNTNEPLNDLVKVQPQAATPISANSERTTVKVNIQKIDQLINLVGELIIDKETLNSITKELKLSYKKDKNVGRLVDVFTHLHYLGSELQEIALSARMVPLETIFNKFPRMVRDLAVKCNKNIHFTIEGQQHGIDRGMIEEIMDPLTHLLRNSIDHGIEDEWLRISQGKPAKGNLRLSASQGDNHVLLIVEDDGCGIDVAKIQKKAIEKGWISLDEAEYLSTEEWLAFIFMPGFTTTAQVSDVSGRGVGLDVVKSNIRKLNGQIDVATTVHQGTKFTIKLPLTLAIIKAMLVREDTCTFAIPVASIVEVFRLKDADISERIHSTGYSQILHWRDFTIPLLYLNKIFELNLSPRVNDKLYVVVLGIGEKKTAIVVDEILGEQEIVIKSMGDFVGKDKIFGELTGISGVSILGDGGLAHILDVSAIMKS